MRITRSELRERMAGASRNLRDGAPDFVQFVRRSLLMQLLCVYLVFVLIVLATGVEADRVGRGLILSDIQSTDVALAQEIAIDTDTRLSTIKSALVSLSQLPTIREGVDDDMLEAFNAFRAARHDIDQVYWLDPSGIMRASEPVNLSGRPCLRCMRRSACVGRWRCSRPGAPRASTSSSAGSRGADCPIPRRHPASLQTANTADSWCSASIQRSSPI